MHRRDDIIILKWAKLTQDHYLEDDDWYSGWMKGEIFFDKVSD